MDSLKGAFVVGRVFGEDRIDLVQRIKLFRLQDILWMRSILIEQYLDDAVSTSLHMVILIIQGPKIRVKLALLFTHLRLLHLRLPFSSDDLHLHPHHLSLSP